MPKYIMPVGKSNFEKVRKDGNYYIDKTDLIRQIVNEGAEVTLFTRPRRFGKTLNMSMLESFFDIRRDSKEIFEGLQITDNTELCESWMNQYPTIFISFKDVGGVGFNESLTRLKSIISKLYETHIYLIKENKNIENFNIRKYRAFLEEDTDKVDITDALFLLTKLMYDYYKKTIIILIDEYDVPMAKGDANGYYREITDVIR